MLDIGFWELVTLGLIGLIVLGPDRLPEVAKTLGTWVRKLRALSRSITDELERELEIQNLREELEAKNRAIVEQSKKLAEALNKPVETITEEEFRRHQADLADNTLSKKQPPSEERS